MHIYICIYCSGRLLMIAPLSDSRISGYKRSTHVPFRSINKVVLT